MLVQYCVRIGFLYNNSRANALPNPDPPVLGRKRCAQPRAQFVECNVCFSMTIDPYFYMIVSREKAGVCWPEGQQQGDGSIAWCPSCAIQDVIKGEQAKQSYQCTYQYDDIEKMMQTKWSSPQPPGTRALPPATTEGPAVATPPPTTRPADAPPPPHMSATEERIFSLYTRMERLEANMEARMLDLEETVLGLEQRIDHFMERFHEMTRHQRPAPTPGLAAAKPAPPPGPAARHGGRASVNDRRSGG